MFIILYLMGIPLFALTIIWLIEWYCHLSMTKEFCPKYGYGNYDLFSKQFKKHNWEYKGHFPSSVFDWKTESKYHANIIKFDDVGMVIRNPIDWLLVKWSVRKYIKTNFAKPMLHIWE